MTKSRRCVMGCGRPADSSTPEGLSCTPCDTKAGYENAHSDNGHDTIEKLTVKGSVFKTKAELEAWRDSERVFMAECWICDPSLDLSAKTYVERQGTSRAGVRHSVPLREAGQVKAAIVAEKLGESFHTEIKVAKKADRVTLVAEGAGETMELLWDLAGRFVTGTWSVNLDGAHDRIRLVRNVSEAYRVLGVAK